MTPTEQQLLAAITDDPSDIAARLAYSDWLEENAGVVACGACSATGASWGSEVICAACSGTGSVSDGRMEQSEFIRIQCELATQEAEQHKGNPEEQASPCELCVRFGELRRRERELLERHWTDWRTDALNPRTMLGSVSCSNLPNYSQASAVITFRRGFVERVECIAQQWLAHGPEIVRTTPITADGVRLTDKEPDAHHTWFNLSYNGTGWEHRHHVPSEWFVLLAGQRREGDARWMKSYPTAAAALADLSRVALTWARANDRDGTLRTMPEWETPIGGK